MRAELEFLFKLQYQTQYDAQGSEHELCWVYAGRSAERPLSNINEIAAWRYITPQALQAEIARAPESFTPWFKLEWAKIVRAYPRVLGTTASIATRSLTTLATSIRLISRAAGSCETAAAASDARRWRGSVLPG